METPDHRLDDAIRQAIGGERTRPAEHPEPDVLLAYHQGALSGPETERVREHIVECDECCQAILDFESFPDLEPPSEAERMTPVEVQRGWRELRGRISRERSGGWWRESAALPAAAVFLVAAFGLGLWGWNLRQQVGELRTTVDGLQAMRIDQDSARGDVIGATLAPEETTRGGEAGDPETVSVPERGGIILWLDFVERGQAFDRYVLDLRNAAGDSLLSGLPLELERDGFFVYLPHETLKPGPHEIVVSGVGNGGAGRVEVAKYSLAFERGGVADR